MNDISNIYEIDHMPSPGEIRREIQVSAKHQAAVASFRRTVSDILDGADMRLLAMVGPCAIHDVEGATEFANRLAGLAKELADDLFIVMRVYFEKPRGSTGWKGLIYDPFLDDSFRIEQGVRVARKFLAYLARMGVPAATEALDPIVPQYMGDLISWTIIGQRASESNAHKSLASGLPTPVGFKNAPHPGGVETAINSIRTASRRNAFLGIDDSGTLCVCRTRGNACTHIVLRGDGSPNYGRFSVVATERFLANAGLPLRIVVDCSHGNSRLDPRRQAEVLDDVIRQIETGNKSIVGFMLESYLGWGCQPLRHDRDRMEYGVSVTDPCIDWDTTESILRDAAKRFAAVKENF